MRHDFISEVQFLAIFLQILSEFEQNFTQPWFAPWRRCSFPPDSGTFRCSDAHLDPMLRPRALLVLVDQFSSLRWLALGRPPPAALRLGRLRGSGLLFLLRAAVFLAFGTSAQRDFLTDRPTISGTRARSETS
jgi:hypothetical protein